MNPAHKQFTLIIRVACILLFLGRGWQHIFWDAPFRTVLWDESLFSGIVQFLTNMSWQEYVTHPKYDLAISFFTKAIGIFYIFMAGVCLRLKSTNRKFGKTLIVASTSLFILSFLYLIEKSWRVGMLIEHASQYGLPLVFYIALFKENYLTKYLLFFKILIALTFIGHGLFAVGFHPVPGNFVDMIISVFGISEEDAYTFLKVAGTIDFIAGISLFYRPLVSYGLIFNIFWGSTTAFARIIAYFDFDLIAMSAHQWIPEATYRLPHGLLPLGLYLSLKKLNRIK